MFKVTFAVYVCVVFFFFLYCRQIIFFELKAAVTFALCDVKEKYRQSAVVNWQPQSNGQETNYARTRTVHIIRAHTHAHTRTRTTK